MNRDENPLVIVNSVSEIHRLLLMAPPMNPLITLIDHSEVSDLAPNDAMTRMVLNFYQVCVKKDFKGQMKYGRNYYDFDKGTVTFSAPNQVIAINQGAERDRKGWSLMFHPDLIRNHPLGRAIKKYGFFGYEASEALHLSDEEEQLIAGLVENINNECASRIDHYSADVIVSNLELLLNYCNRFYNRQFITRKMANHDLLTKFENVLSKYFDEDGPLSLPTVKSLASELNVSSSYLSDMLRTITGQNTQQHIHEKLIEKAKVKLITTNLSVSEIAFMLGFEYPQSFNKLFKNKLKVSPLQYRQSSN